MLNRFPILVLISTVLAASIFTAVARADAPEKPVPAAEESAPAAKESAPGTEEPASEGEPGEGQAAPNVESPNAGLPKPEQPEAETPAEEQPSPEASPEMPPVPEDPSADPAPEASPMESPETGPLALEPPSEKTPAPEERDAPSPEAPAPLADEPLPPPQDSEEDTPESNTPEPDTPESDTPPGEPKLQFNFRFQPWSEVIRWLAEEAGYSLILDAAPPGTFNYMDDRLYTPAEALDLLNSVLLTKGYTLVLRERMLLVVNLEDEIPPALVTRVAVEDLDKHGKYELLSTRFQLRGITSEQGRLEIEGLLGPQGKIVELPQARQLIVTETGGRLREIRDVLDRAQATGDPANQELKWFELKSVSPDEALALLRQIFEIPEEGNATADGSLRFAADPIGLRLLVSADPGRLEQIEKMLKTIDQPAYDQPEEGAAEAALQIEVYDIAPADAESVLKVTQTLLAENPGVRLALDPKTGYLIALARPAGHATIKATIEQMRKDAQSVEVLDLRVLDPQVAVLAINRLFGTESDEAPKIDADLANRRLLIRGSTGQIAEIRSLLAKMGETFGGPAGGKLRVLPMDSENAEQLIERLEALWPTLGGNELRVMRRGMRRMQEPPPGMIDERTPVPGSQDETDRPPMPRTRPMHLRERGSGRTGATETRTVWLCAAEETPDGARSVPVRASNEAKDEPSKTAKETPHGVTTNGARSVPVRASNEGKVGPSETAEETPHGVTTNGARSVPVRALDEAKNGPPETTKETPDRGVTTNESPQPSPTARSSTPVPSPQSPIPRKGVTTNDPPIFLFYGPNGLVVSSEDTEALDRLQGLIDTLQGGRHARSSEPKLTVFYLRNAQAETISQTLTQLFAGAAPSSLGAAPSAPAGNQPSRGGQSGNTSSNAGTLGGIGVAGSFGRLTPSGPVSITADGRLNALFVQAAPDDVDMIERILKVLDRSASPEDVPADAKPRLIQVRHTAAAEIAEVVKEVYQEQLSSGNNNNRPRNPIEMMMMMRGRRGGDSRSGQSGAAQAEAIKLSIGVDERTNSLIVLAPEVLFEEIRMLVHELDEGAAGETETVQVVRLGASNAETVRDTLSTLLGDSVQTDSNSRSSRNSRSSSNRSSRNGRSFRGFGGFPMGPPGGFGGFGGRRGR